MGTFLKDKKDKSFVVNYLSFYLVPRPGVEPGRIAPLVFETSASTDSAIWALRVQRYNIFFNVASVFVYFCFIVPNIFFNFATRKP